ncbi:MAG: tetratricopeptide repeat protein, partial [Cyanobacteriota bacterium]
MSDQHQLEHVNEENEDSLQMLVAAIELEEFSLIFARCNYGSLRDRMVERLRELCPGDIRAIALKESDNTLFTTIKNQLGDEKPAALMVFGFESVRDIDQVLISTNQVREEFSKNFSFPVVLWLHDEVLKKLSRLAPDFRSWGISCEFVMETDELVALLQENADCIFSQTLEAGDNFRPNCDILDARYRVELDAAQKDLQRRGYQLQPELEASLQFIWGRDEYANSQIDQALILYQQSLEFWQQSNNLERQGVLLFHIGLCYCQKGDWQQARDWLQQCLDGFEQAQRLELVAKFIGQLGKILQRLEAWEELWDLAQKALKLHETYSMTVGARYIVPLQAQDYGFLAEVALQQSKWAEANQFARQALEILSQVPEYQQHQGLYLLLLARSQQCLKQESEAIETLKQAKDSTVPQYDPQLYIRILAELRSLYYKQRQYLEAFEIKQEQRAIEQQYGFRAFVGAGRLTSPPAPLDPPPPPFKRGENKSLLSPISLDPPQPPLKRGESAEGETQDETVFGRQQDIKRLLDERIKAQNQKLTIIHGPSGVGKSSIIDAGLVPKLKENIGERRGLPIVLRVYTNWIGALGEALKEALKESKNIDVTAPNSLAELIEQLQKNDKERNLLTVLIFDQFEEYFFIDRKQVKRQELYELLKLCINRTMVQSVRIILSLREDYLHCLLEGERVIKLDNDDLDILSKKNRYYLGNFTEEDAKSVIESLTQRSQFTLEPALIDELVRDLAGELREVRPIELQVVGAQLQDDNVTTLEQYRRLGENPKAELVELYLKGVIQDCGEENKDIAQLILYLLTDENNTRPLKTRAELAASLESKADKLDLVLTILVGSRLVVRVPESTADRYQLVHDYLVEFIRQQQGAELLEELNREKEQRILTEQRLRELQIGQSDALSRHSDELFREGKVLDALIEGLRAGIPLKWAGEAKVDNSTRVQVANVLRQAVYGVRERNRLEGHDSTVRSVSFSPDGKTLASGSNDNTIKIWNLATGKLISTLTRHELSVNSVSFSPDGKTLASGSNDNTIKIWNLATGNPITTLTRHELSVRSVSFSPDGKTLASGSNDNTIKVRNLATGKAITLTDHYLSVNSVSFSPDGKTLASGSNDNTIKIWNLATSEEITTLTGHYLSVNSVSFSPDGKTLASGSADNTIKIWNLATGNPITTLTGHTSTVNSVSFSPDGKTLASGSGDNTIKVWNLATGKAITTLTGHTSTVSSVSFSPDSKTLASGSADNTIKVWNLATGKAITTLTGHDSWVSSVSFSPDSKMIASGSDDNTIKVWNLATGKKISSV